ncbi:MAG TPA: 30S ribosomal protein S16 [Mycobacteriales bacterium]|nr:30S ribosomal protein S16 [Mycobacteriales bacterium]
MATKIRLMRLGKIRNPQYRIVVSDARNKRDGRFIEAVGKYHPKEDPSFIEVDSERVQYWLSVGAQPTDPVAAILRITGDLQRHKGEPAESTLKPPAPRRDRKAAFEEAAREGLGEARGEATTPKKKAPAKAAPAEPQAEAPAATEPQAPAEPETPAAEGAADAGAAAADATAETTASDSSDAEA